METKSAYIHIPFCVRICTYCDFNKYFIHNQPVDEYLNCLIKEFRQPEKKELNTMFVGGGTPTALSIKQLMITTLLKMNILLKQTLMNLQMKKFNY